MSMVSAAARKIIPYAVVLILVLALWFRGEWYARRAYISDIQLRSAVAISNANAALAAEQARLAKKVDARAAVNAAHKRELYLQSDVRRKAITDAPLEDDGPLAPVLRDQLDRLPIAPITDASRRGSAATDPSGTAHAK